MDVHEKNLMDLIGHAVFVIEAGSDGLPRYTGCNAFALSAIGKSEKEVLGLTARELFPGRAGNLAFDHQVEVLKSGKERTYELLLPMPDGQRRIITRLMPDWDDYGNVVRLIGSSSDISSQQLVHEMRTNAQAINTEMVDFINLAAHDLRVPMRHVRTIAEMLREDFEDQGDGKFELIDMLEDIGNKAMSLIGDVLARAQTTSVHAECVEFSLSDLLDEIMGVLDPMNTCKITAPDIQIQGDQTATQMILRNLIDNAIKVASAQNAVEEDTLPLHLTLCASEAEGFVEIAVQDSGCGFADTAIVFLNGGKLRTDSGFGMLGVRQLIHRRGGSLMATNAEDAGAIVSFTLPGRLCGDAVETTRLVG